MGGIAMRLIAALAVLGCLTVHAAFAAPQEPRTLTLDSSERDLAWCGGAKESSKHCLGPGDRVIATAGGDGEITNPRLCLDGEVIPTGNPKKLGGNRFRFKIPSQWNPSGGVDGHRVTLVDTEDEGKKCPTSVTQFVDVAVTKPLLGRELTLLSFLGIVLLVLLVVWKFPAFLKDPRPDLAPERRPWSLGRAQLAWWTAIVFAGWVVILVSTGNYESFTSQALVLLSVSVATTVTAGAVQANKEREKAKVEASQKEWDALEANLAANPAPATAMVAGQRMQQLAGEQAVAPVYQGNVGFFSDLLKDGDTPSLARLQAVLWTVALGAIFVWQVLAKMTMPAFSTELLFLAGISSGTFLFGKIAERTV
jgi:hypothetical protein